MEYINQTREILEQIKINKKFHDIKVKNQDLVEESTDRQRIYGEIISLINNKKIHMLGPEKSITARFIAENHNEIINIIINCLRNKMIP